MKDRSLYSIVMCVYNTEKYLRQAVESVLNQTLSDFEFLILDDASTDNSYEILKKYEKKDNRIKLYRNEQNSGFTKSLNKIISHAKTEYILKMDSDDISHPQRAGKMYSILEKEPDIALVSHGYEKIDENGKAIGKQVGIEAPEIIREGLLGVSGLGGAFMFRRSAYIEVGGVDERYRYAQDYDFELKLSERWKVYSVPETLYQHRVHENAISQKNIAERKELDDEIREAALKRISEHERAARPIPDIDRLKKRYGMWSLSAVFNDFGCHYINHGMLALGERMFNISKKINPYNPKTWYYLRILLPKK